MMTMYEYLISEGYTDEQILYACSSPLLQERGLALYQYRESPEEDPVVGVLFKQWKPDAERDEKKLRQLAHHFNDHRAQYLHMRKVKDVYVFSKAPILLSPDLDEDFILELITSLKEISLHSHGKKEMREELKARGKKAPLTRSKVIEEYKQHVIYNDEHYGNLASLVSGELFMTTREPILKAALDYLIYTAGDFNNFCMSGISKNLIEGVVLFSYQDLSPTAKARVEESQKKLEQEFEMFIPKEFKAVIEPSSLDITNLTFTPAGAKPHYSFKRNTYLDTEPQQVHYNKDEIVSISKNLSSD